MSKVKSILCLFDYKCHTGFGNVAKHMVRELRKSFPAGSLKLHIVGINYFGEKFKEDADTEVISAKLEDVKQDSFGRHVFAKALLEGNYDGIFIMQDVGVICPYIDVLKNIKQKRKENNLKSFKSVFYFPIDCELYDASLLTNLEFFDHLYTYNEFSRSEVLRVRPDLKGRIRVIPHGVDTSKFYPVEPSERLKFREMYFGNNANKFIINAANRNQPRKDIPAVIFAFEALRESLLAPADGLFLYLHMNPLDPKGWDLRRVLAQTGLKEGRDYGFPAQSIENHGADSDLLNNIYNASDAYLTMNRGEGWGLIPHEMMACKVPVVAPLHTSFEEMSGGGQRMWVLENLFKICDAKDNIIRYQADYDEAAKQLGAIYYDQRLGSTEYKKKLDAAYRWATSLNWKTVGAMWADVFRRAY